MELNVNYKEFKASGILAQHVLLKSIKFIDGHFYADGEFSTPSLMDTKNLRHSAWKYQYQFNEERNELSVISFFELNSAPKKGKASFQIRASIQANYILDTEPPPADLRNLFFDSFAQHNCLIHVWPYWREFASSSANRLNLPYWTEPVIHFRLKKTPAKVMDKKSETIQSSKMSKSTKK